MKKWSKIITLYSKKKNNNKKSVKIQLKTDPRNR